MTIICFIFYCFLVHFGFWKHLKLYFWFDLIFFNIDIAFVFVFCDSIFMLCDQILLQPTELTHPFTDTSLSQNTPLGLLQRRLFKIFHSLFIDFVFCVVVKTTAEVGHNNISNEYGEGKTG